MEDKQGAKHSHRADQPMSLPARHRALKPGKKSTMVQVADCSHQWCEAKARLQDKSDVKFKHCRNRKKEQNLQYDLN